MSALLLIPEPPALIDLCPIASSPPLEAVEPEQDRSLVPPVPETIDDTGLAHSVIEQLAFKFLYFRGEMLGRDLATAMGFKFSLSENLVDDIKKKHLVQ